MAESKSSSMISIPPEIEAEMTPAVKAFVLAAFAQFEARIAEVEKQVKQLSAKSPKATPNNSSLPSSTIHPHNDKDKPGKKKPKSKLKRGGQIGHRKHSRELVPPEQCTLRSSTIIPMSAAAAAVNSSWMPTRPSDIKSGKCRRSNQSFTSTVCTVVIVRAVVSVLLPRFPKVFPRVSAGRV